MKLFRSIVSLLAVSVLAHASAAAEVELISGFNFGQFIGGGYPSTDGLNGLAVGFVRSNFARNVAPAAVDSGAYHVANGVEAPFSAGVATLYFDGTHGSGAWDYSGGSNVSVEERGSLVAINHDLVNGRQMFIGDDNNAALVFAAGAVTDFSIVADTTGWSDFSPAEFNQPNDFNFTFSAYSRPGAAASIQWFFDGVPVGAPVAVAPGEFQAFNLDLPSGFYGRPDATLVGRVSGQVVIDHVQINGVKATPAVFTQQPESKTVVAGADASFTVAVGGAANPSYRWRFNGADLTDGAGVSGAGTATLLISAVTSARAGSYTVLVNNNGVVAESAAAVLTVHVAPVFTLQPHSATANPGETVVFEAEASGFPAPAYQWFKDAQPLVDGGRVSGSSTGSLRLSDLVAGDEGVYTVRITNAAGSAESGAAMLTVTDDTLAPSIQQQPAATVAVVGRQAVFRVVATGAPAPSYQWFKGETQLVDGDHVSGSGTSTLRVAPASLADGGLYRVVVSNSAGAVESEAAALTVYTLPVIPSGSAPQGGWVNVGGSFTFTVAADGVPAPTYQWFKDGQPLEGKTSSSLALENVSDADAGSYTVVITNSAGTTESAPAVLQVATPARITAEPVGAGANVSLRVTAAGYPAPSYQWFKNGDAIAGATDAVLSLGAVSLASAGDYTVVVSNAGGSDTSEVARLEVAASIRRGAAARTFAPGSRVSLDSGFAPKAGYRFVWLRDGAVIRGAIASTYLIADGRGADSGSYSVRVYSAGGRLLATVTVARVSFSVAGTYDALLRSTTDQAPAGVVRVVVAANKTYTGSLVYEDGRSYALAGRFAFLDSPSAGSATATVKRGAGLTPFRVVLALDAREASLDVGLFEGEAFEPASVGEGERRAAATVAWRGRYALKLAPVAPSEGQPSATATLGATINAAGAMTLSGRLADGKLVTASVPGSVERGYAVFLRPYAKGGYLGGLLRLEKEAGGAYKADTASGGRFVWFRPAAPGVTGIDLELDSLLAAP